MKQTATNIEIEDFRDEITDFDKNTVIDLYEMYFSKIYKFFRFRLNNTKICEDLTSKVFLRIMEDISRYPEREKRTSAWIFTIARNVLIDYYRKADHTRTISSESIEYMDILDLDEFTPEKSLLNKERKKILIELINNKLNEREKEVLSLKFAGFFKNYEIADITGLTANNVSVILHRAILKLKKELEKYEDILLS